MRIDQAILNRLEERWAARVRELYNQHAKAERELTLINQELRVAHMALAAVAIEFGKDEGEMTILRLRPRRIDIVRRGGISRAFYDPREDTFIIAARSK